MATSGQLRWPPVGRFVTAYGQDLMAAESGRSECAEGVRCAEQLAVGVDASWEFATEPESLMCRLHWPRRRCRGIRSV